MNMKVLFIIVAAVILITILTVSSIFVIPEGRQALITEFGKPVGEPIKDAGLHFKWPFIQEVRELDSRILRWDGNPSGYQTNEKNVIIVDTTARWRIVDPKTFLEKVQDEERAKKRLDDSIDNAMVVEVAKYKLIETVRNTNDIFKKIKEIEEARARGDFDEDADEVTSEIAKIEVGREKLSQLILERARPNLRELGIELVDVILRRVSLEKGTERDVFNRMIEERKRIANKHRSVGQGELARIRGEKSRQLQEIESGAYRKVQEILGTAESEAVRIYAEALQQDPLFYEFVRTLEAYDKAIGPDTHFILSTDSEFLRLFKKGPGTF